MDVLELVAQETLVGGRRTADGHHRPDGDGISAGRHGPPHPDPVVAVPAEGNFPVVVVAAHGLLAVTTLILALLTALG